MSDARSLSPLSAADYDAISAAVMETARGRWFLSEYARRNRQTDTETVLSAIARLERLCTVPVALPDLGPEFSETARTIAELRDDLDRGGASARLSARIQETTASIIDAAESIQEIAWALREAGAEPELCDRLDRRATEIYGATTVIEAGANQIEKVADTVAMLDASLRAAADVAVAAEEPLPAMTAAPAHPTVIDPATDLGDIDVVDAGTKQRVPLNETGLRQQTQPYRRRSSTQVAENDIAFADVGAPAESIVLPETASSARLELSYSEADLRAIASLPVEDRLHFFG